MQRRLAAILAADVVGYSAMMGRDEAGTLAALRAFRTSEFTPTVTGHGGTVVKNMGDGWLVEFASVVDAVTAAMRLQDALGGHPGLSLRFGVHIGDITRDGDDIFGDGVNIAARLESLARPGQLLISDPAYGSLDGTLAPAFDDQGETRLKNIARPLRVWARMPPAPAPRPGDAAAPGAAASGLPRLAIQPFATSDPRPGVAEIAASLTSDIQTYLGQLSWLDTMITETPPDRAYRLQAVLRTRGDRLRLEPRLFAPDGSEAWAAKFDGDLADAFDWQDKVGEDIASELIGITLDTETRRLAGLTPADMTAGQAFLAGMMTWRSYAPESFFNALTLHRRAIEANPDLVAAHAEAIIVMIAGRTLSLKQIAEFDDDYLRWVASAQRFAGQSVVLDLSLALADYMDSRDTAAAVLRFTDCLRRAPFDARVLSFAGWSFIWAGKPDRGLECHLRGIRLGRFSPFYIAALGGVATALVQLGRPEEALAYAERGMEDAPDYATFHSTKAAACAMLGRMDEAAVAIRRHMDLAGRDSISAWRSYNDYGGSEGGERYFAALRKAGMPD